MLTGVRLSMGVAWLVIVAAEMLTGGVGLGFWVWDEWNNLKVENILIAIIVIGMIGLALEQLLLLAAKRWQYDQAFAQALSEDGAGRRLRTGWRLRLWHASPLTAHRIER